ncbi:hypothetical protein RP75_06510 [Agrobacterium arsenijevicii]|uniref:Uncharacterized protein n=2 Tax=Rhizobiaceae TaxID=82115 RepID=A0ABR5DCI7_9HYPH|nr:hypothetical protein RP75_06510 [Agrobacterium arsenijevicii]
MLIFSPFAHFPTKNWKIPFYRHNYCQHVLTPLPITIVIEKADRKDLAEGGSWGKNNMPVLFRLTITNKGWEK